MSESAEAPEQVHFFLSRDLRQRLREQAKAEDRTQRAVLERALRRELQIEPGARSA